MKKKNLKLLASASLTAGILLANQLHGNESDSHDPNSENAGYSLMTESELMKNLNSQGKEIYENLSPEGKKLALKVASRLCNGTNECKGLNACRTTDHECAGQGSCKGTTKCSLGDKNLAVKLVAKYMAEKRQKAQN